MKPLFRRFAGAAFALLLVISALPTSALAAPEGKEDEDLPHPSEYLKKAYLNLRQLDSYRVSLRVEGGLSKDEKHTLSRVTVRQSYLGDVFQNKLMHLPGINAFRTPKKGVIKAGGIWKNALGDKQGILMERLFTFPLEVMSKAVRHSRRAGWVKSSIDSELEFELVDPEEGNRPEPGAGGDVDDLFDDLFGEEEETKDDDKAERDESASGREERRGKTVVARPDDEEGKDLRLPRIVRIEVPPKEALKHYLAVEKSGCIGGG